MGEAEKMEFTLAEAESIDLAKKSVAEQLTVSHLMLLELCLCRSRT